MLLWLLSAVAPAARCVDDNIFPPAAAARPFIDFDGRGFLVNGRRTFIASGGMEYARVPRALWRDRLLRIKRAGLNTVEIYVFWNYHEPREGQWEFSGDRDLGAFLRLVKEVGLYATVRVGPYVCAEWDSGGYPVWLRFKPGLSVREANAPFEAAVDRYFEHIFPIIAANQISHGGAVILVQLENEHPKGWGTTVADPYFRHLQEKALSLGLQVPYFFSGLHHASDPAGNTPWDSVGRKSPWMSTEFWSVWYDHYGPRPGDAATYARRTWKIIAYGGNGYNYYMVHGGTNFDHFNNDEDASSYDYGAAIGQAGDLRPTFYAFKRAALFARSFQDVLEDSVNTSARFAGAATGGVGVLARTSPAGTLLFLDNPLNAPVQTQIKDTSGALQPSVPITLAPGELFPVVRGYAVTPHIMIDQSVTRILGTVRNGKDTTLVVYGPPGEHGSLQLSSAQAMTSGGSGSASADGHTATLALDYPSTGSQSTLISVGRERLRVLTLSDTLADHTFFVDIGPQTYIVSGPDFVGEGGLVGGRLQFQAEFHGPTPAAVTEYAPDLSQAVLTPRGVGGAMPAAPTLAAWKQHAVTEAQPSVDDTHWLAADAPPPMGADGDDGAYAWYRTTLTIPAAGTYYLTAGAVRDRMIVFVDGTRLSDEQVTGRSARLELSAGKHALALLAAHYGRNKLVPYIGPLDTIDAKGVTGGVTLSRTPLLALGRWAALPPTPTRPDATQIPAATDPGWQEIRLGQDLFSRRRGFAWCQIRIAMEAQPGGAGGRTVLHFDSVDDNATVFVNGHLVGAHQGSSKAFDIDATAAWNMGQANVITLLIENTGGPGGLYGQPTVTHVSASDSVTGWHMRGGIGVPGAGGTGGPRPTPAPPAFYQVRFTAPAAGAVGPHPILRVHLGGLSRGFVWLNGHNLGRYPEKIPVDGIYLPECWINAGRANSLAIFDEDGRRPNGVYLSNEEAAGRYVTQFAAAPSGRTAHR